MAGKFHTTIKAFTVTNIVSIDIRSFLARLDVPASDLEYFKGSEHVTEVLFRPLLRKERDAIILEILETIDSFSSVGSHRHDIWSAAWSDIAKRYRSGGRNPELLNPLYFVPDRPMRVDGDWLMPMSENNELKMFGWLRHWLFCTQLTGTKRVYELGCGSGYNLVALAKLRPDLDIIGLDWAQSAISLINEFTRDHSYSVRGMQFDFYHPEIRESLGPDSTVMTFCALEQTGDHGPHVADWLLTQTPGRVIHVEPTPELYEPGCLVDSLALKYHRHRGYLSGLLPRLRALAEERRVELEQVTRLRFGSLYNECYTVIIWKPL